MIELHARKKLLLDA